METRLYGYLDNLDVDTYLISKLNKLNISYDISYIAARKSGLTIEEAHKALSLVKEFSKHGLEILVARIESNSQANISLVIKRWRDATSYSRGKKHHKPM